MRGQQSSCEIREARPGEYALLPAIEADADRLFEAHGIGPLPPPAAVKEYLKSLLVLVSGNPPVAFARVSEVDGHAHLEQISVRPDYFRKGIGSGLVRAACAESANLGYRRITAITFQHVPWNAQFYSGLGFRAVSRLTPGLSALREREMTLGLDSLGARIVLCFDIPSGGPPTDGYGESFCV